MCVSMRMVLCLLFFVPLVAGAGEDTDLLKQPEVTGAFGRVATQLAGNYVVVLKPDKDEAEWWAGAPSVTRGADGIFWMACRMRMAEAPRGRRGYEIRILKSSDGEHFDVAGRITRESVPIPGFERPALLNDPKTGKYKLYACGPWNDGPWCIIKFEDAVSPVSFNPVTARPVIVPRSKNDERDLPPVEYKDPFILFAEDAFHCYVIGYVRQNERIFHFQSPDGESWEPVGNPYEPIMSLSGWHDFFVRPSSVVPVGAGYLFVYEGSKTTWRDPVYNVATGMAYTFDLHHLIDLTPDSPIAISSTPSKTFATFRYSHWLRVGGEVWVYAEVTCPNDTKEIRLYKLKDQ